MYHQYESTILPTIVISLERRQKKERIFYGQADRKGGGGVQSPRPWP